MADPHFLLDSNICIYLLRDASPVLTAKVLDCPAGTLFVSAIAFAEVALGYGDRATRAPDLAAFTRAVTVLEFGAAAALVHATLPFRRGRFDRLIAAHALAVDMTLVTNNERDFADIPGLRIENWTL